MKKYKIFGIILINIIMAFLILVYFDSKLKDKSFNFSQYVYNIPDDSEILVETEEKPKDFVQLNILERYKDNNKNIIGSKYKKHHIVVFSCALDDIQGIKKEKSFLYMVSKFSKRPVADFNQCGEDILQNLYSSGFKYTNKNLFQNVEYVILKYNSQDYFRLYQQFNIMKNYERFFKTSKLEHKLIQIYAIRYAFSYFRMLPYMNRIEDFLANGLFMIHQKIKNTIPNAKIITIVYDKNIESNNITNSKINYNILWDKYEELTGSKVIYTKDITGEITSNKQIWEVFTPKFAKKYLK